MLEQLLVSPAERADVIVDFTRLPLGTEIYMINEAPDEPFGGGIVGDDFPAADPHTTGQVMKLVVGPMTRGGRDTSLDPATGGLALPTPATLGVPENIRTLALLEEDSAVLHDIGPRHALLGVVRPSGDVLPTMWDDPITENVRLGATELWEIFNFTEDAHPIHVHLVQFAVVERQSMEENGIRGPEPWETGFKDTVIAYPQEITRIKAKFDVPGRFVWHCHIVEHEDHEMMRPYVVE
jgi:spore coat protein A, manganese oxidase